jgi:hypothetical protein
MRRLMSNGRVPKKSPISPISPINLIQEPISAERARSLILGHRAVDGMRVLGHLNLSGATNIDRLSWKGAPLGETPRTHFPLPENLTCESLDISDCPYITTLPIGLHVTHSIEIAGSGIRSLPAGHGFSLRWRGVHVDDRIAFAAESLTGQEILRTDNVEIRRIAIDRLGYETFLEQVGGLIRDRDTDAGGDRQLICIAFEDDEPLMLLKVICPSTGHLHVLRVPPYMDTCHQSAAWIAGFDNPDDYHPAIEA